MRLLALPVTGRLIAMTHRLKFWIVFCSSLLTVMLVIGALMGKDQGDQGAYKPLGVYSEVLRHIKSDYVEDPDISKVTRGALQGLIEHLDPMSSYLGAEEHASFQESQANPDKGTGLSTGLVVHKRVGYVTVLSVLPGSSADKAGIRIGDLIEAVDGLSTRAMPPAYLYALLSGEPDTSVRVLVRSLRNSEEPEEYTLKRGPVVLPAAEHKVLDGGVGYLDVDVLDKERVDQVAKAIKELESQGVSKFVLDLRANSVGDTAEGVRLANFFMDEGKIASLKGQQYPEKLFAADSETTLTRLPLVLITDRATAGGAELAAAALLDSKRAKLVGERTYGLAALQKTILLEDGAALILSIAKYHRPTGEALQDGGVTPSDPVSPADVRRYRESQFPSDLKDPPPVGVPAEEDGEDPYLKKALEVVKEEAAAPEEKAA